MSLLLTGCVAPKAVVEAPSELQRYRKIYLAIPEQDPRKVFPRILAKLKQCEFEVVEMTPDGMGGGSQGSGFIITPQGHLLTCAHVVKGTNAATVWINGARHPANVIATDTNLDVALLQLAGNQPFKYLKFSPEQTYRMGQEIFTMGFPLVEVLGTSPRLNKGLVSSTVGLSDNPKQLQVSAEVQPGNSGGPLLDAEGRVLGLVFGTLNSLNVLVRTGGSVPQNVNFGIKNPPLLDFIRSAGVDLAGLGENPSATGFEAARDSLGLVRAGNVRDEDLTAPSLFCLVKYFSFWDLWYRFRVFHMEFRDAKTGKVLLRAGQYADNPFSSEDGVIERTFQEIYPQFFPDRPNPFKASKAKPAPEPK